MLALACYAVQRRRVYQLGASNRNAFNKAQVTLRWAEGGLALLEGQLAQVAPERHWDRSTSLQVKCCVVRLAWVCERASCVQYNTHASIILVGARFHHHLNLRVSVIAGAPTGPSLGQTGRLGGRRPGTAKPATAICDRPRGSTRGIEGEGQTTESHGGHTQILPHLHPHHLR